MTQNAGEITTKIIYLCIAMETGISSSPMGHLGSFADFTFPYLCFYLFLRNLLLCFKVMLEILHYFERLLNSSHFPHHP